MGTKIIDGKLIAAKLKSELKLETDALKQAGHIPGLAVVIVGNNPASRSYVTMKEKDCEEVGIRSFEYALPEETPEAELLGLIDALNMDPAVDGILVQLPIPKHMNENIVLERIAPDKDVDGFHPINSGRLMAGRPVFVPCTPAGVMVMIKEAGVEVSGKNCVIVGRSNIVGKPMAMLLMQANGTVTVCHSKTKNLSEVCAQADILVAAIGRAKMIGKDYIKPGAVVIDVGINRDENGKMVGDVDFEAVAPLTSAITPVPGGVGPMTRALLLANTLTACKLHKGMTIS